MGSWNQWSFCNAELLVFLFWQRIWQHNCKWLLQDTNLALFSHLLVELLGQFIWPMGVSQHPSGRPEDLQVSLVHRLPHLPGPVRVWGWHVSGGFIACTSALHDTHTRASLPNMMMSHPLQVSPPKKNPPSKDKRDLAILRHGESLVLGQNSIINLASNHRVMSKNQFSSFSTSFAQ